MVVDPIDVGVLEELYPDVPEHAGFERFQTLELTLVGAAEEIDPGHGSPAVVVPCADTLIFGVIGHHDVSPANGGIDQAVVFADEIITTGG